MQHTRCICNVRFFNNEYCTDLWNVLWHWVVLVQMVKTGEIGEKCWQKGIIFYSYYSRQVLVDSRHYATGFERVHLGSHDVYLTSSASVLMLFFWRRFLFSSLLHLLPSSLPIATCLCRNVQISDFGSARGSNPEFNQCSGSVSLQFVG